MRPQVCSFHIRFKHRHSQRDYFAFEAKRLHVTYPKGRFSTEYPTYAGEEGMMAFVEGQYSKGYLAGGMLGYVMDARSDSALSGLEKQVDARRSALKLVPGSKLSKSGMSHAVPNALNGTRLSETEHDVDAHPLRLFHLLLRVHQNHAGVRIVASSLSFSQRTPA